MPLSVLAVITVEPGVFTLILPRLSIEATAGLLEEYCTFEVEPYGYTLVNRG